MPRPKASNFSKKIREALAERVGYLCSNPSCLVPTIRPGYSSPDSVERVGRAAHIRAASEGGPRYDPQQSEAERRSAANGIFLCANCADMIDDNNGEDYSPEQLLEWKNQAEEKQRKAFATRNQILPSIWRRKLHYVSYVNIPRMLLQCAGAGYQISNPPQIDGWLHNKGQETGRIAAAFCGLLDQIELSATDYDTIKIPSAYGNDLVGLTISFDLIFRTRNGVSPPYANTPLPVLTGSLASDPHIYCDEGFRKIVIAYDPRWITTSTAFCEFRPTSGQQRIAGLAVIKNVDGDTVFASPLLMGLPSNPLMEAIFRPTSARTIAIPE